VAEIAAGEGGHTQPTTESAVRVSTLELFFDLVFVFTITQLTALLAKDISLTSVAQVVLMLSVIWWMYDGYAWLTNAVALPAIRQRRFLYLIGMGGFLGIALAIPTAFGAAGWVFGLSYFVVNAVHTGLFLHGGGAGIWAVMRHLGPLNLISATLVLVGGITTGGWRWALWTVALAVIIASPYLNPLSEFSISPAHFVERHGLVVIIAIGESIVAIGVGAAGLPVDVALLVVAMLGLTLSYMLWWVYFEGGDAGAEHALAAIEPHRRARVAVHAYGFAHVPILLGIVAFAAGLKKAIGHVVGHLEFDQAIVLAAGVTVYILGDTVFRRLLRIGVSRFRIAGGVVALAAAPLGLIGAWVELSVLIVIVVATFYAEIWAQRREH
jgi:low temperature requirement protein LtrA